MFYFTKLCYKRYHSTYCHKYEHFVRRPRASVDWRLRTYRRRSVLCMSCIRYHIASCALVLDSTVNVWDVRRPHVPFATFAEHRDVTTAIAWHASPDVFLSTSRVSFPHLFLKSLTGEIFSKRCSFPYVKRDRYLREIFTINSPLSFD